MSKVCLEITGNIMQLSIVYNETDIPWKMTKSHFCPSLVLAIWLLLWSFATCHVSSFSGHTNFPCPVDFRNFTNMISPSKDITWPMKCLTDFFILYSTVGEYRYCHIETHYKHLDTLNNQMHSISLRYRLYLHLIGFWSTLIFALLCIQM